MSPFIVDRCLGTSLHRGVFLGGRAVVRGPGSHGWAEGEFAYEFAAVESDDADVEVVDQEADSGSAAAGAASDVV